MKELLALLTLKASPKRQVVFLFAFISIVYFYNFSVNDIWTPNESFYAEAVREMFETGNFLEISYNYEPRYNKPPLTYWVMALSSSIFGINEFALRLPILLLGLGSIWVTFLLGKLMYGFKGGLYTMLMMAFSLQLLAVKQYASPEMPLTFFFTLTLYNFLKGYRTQKFKPLLIAYFSLGLAVLTKGYPYLIVIGGIIGLFLLWDNWGNWKVLWKRIRQLKLQIGIPIVVLIGISWVIFMYLKDGQEFWITYKRETFDRAFTRESNGLKPFYYLEVMTWTIIPYSLAFFYALIYWIKNWRGLKEINFQMSWFLIMLLIFTVAKGKLPTYFIQAHPAMILMITPLLLKKEFKGSSQLLWYFAFGLLPPILLGMSFYLVLILNLSPFLYLITIVGLVGYILWLIKKKTPDTTVALPFWAMSIFLIVFASYFPKMENYRPYDDIGEVISKSSILESTPIQIEGTLIHNIPFYAQRRAIRDSSPSMFNESTQETLALVKTKNLDQYLGFERLWSGLIYDFSSESQFFKFVMACIGADSGDLSKFAEYTLIYK